MEDSIVCKPSFYDSNPLDGTIKQIARTLNHKLNLKNCNLGCQSRKIIEEIQVLPLENSS